MYAAFGGSPTVGASPWQQPGAMASGTFNGPAGGAMGGDRGGLAMPGNFLPPASQWGPQADPNAGAWSNPGGQASFGGTSATGQQQQVNAMGVPSTGFGGTPPMAQAAVMPGGGQEMGSFSGLNPWMGGMADDIGRRTNDMLGKNLAGIQGQFVGMGGLGGDRWRIAQGEAIGRATDSYQGNLANLYGGMWNNDQNRQLQYRGQDLSRYQGDQSFWTQQRGQDLQAQDQGFRFLLGGLQAPWIPQQNTSGIYNHYTGFGSGTNSSEQGGGWQGAIGGALGGAQFAKNLGWYGS